MCVCICERERETKRERLKREMETEKPTKVCQFEFPQVADEKVLGLQVPVEDSVAMYV